MQEKITDFGQLTFWQKAHQLALKIYQITRQLPSEEKYGLVFQMRRGARMLAGLIASIEQSKREKYNKGKVMMPIYKIIWMLATGYWLQATKNVH